MSTDPQNKDDSLSGLHNRYNHALIDSLHVPKLGPRATNSIQDSKADRYSIYTIAPEPVGCVGSLRTATEKLSYLISEENCHSSQPQLETIHDIKNYYHTARSNGYLANLSSEDLTSLIRLFGTLSFNPKVRLPSREIVKNDDFCVHPLAALLTQHSRSFKGDYWSFVVTISKDKRRLGHSLNKVDNYWLMHAALDDAHKQYLKEAKDDEVAQCLSRAKTHYLLLKATKDDLFIHRAYISKLLLVGPKAADEITYRLSVLFDWNKELHGYFLESFFHVLSRHGTHVSLPVKRHFLKVLRKKLDKIQDTLPTPSHPDSPSVDIVKRYDAIAIRDYFTNLLFARNPGMKPTLRYLRLIYSWAVFESRAALCVFNDGSFASDREQDDAAWNNLILLSLSYTASHDRVNSSVDRIKPEQGLDGGIYSQAQVLGWTVICSLAALTSELRLHDISKRYINLETPECVQEIARTLWILWRKEEVWRAGVAERRMPLVCSATTSFMALASYSKDSRLASALVRHVSNAIICPARFGGEVLNRSMLETCATYFALMSVTVGVNGPPHKNWIEILLSLRYVQLIPDGDSPRARSWASIVSNSFLREYCRINCLHSFALMKSANECELVLSGETIFQLGSALVSRGFLEPAFECLNDFRIDVESASKLLDLLLHRAHTLQKLDSQLVDLFVKVFLETDIRPSSNVDFEAFILACTRSGFSKETDSILRVICESNLDLLRPQFLSQYLATLVKRRRYKLLGSLLRSTWRREPSRLSVALRQPKLQFIRQLLDRESGTNGHVITRSLPFSIYIWPLMRAHIPFHPRLSLLDRKLLTLKLNSSLKKEVTLDEKVLERAIYLMVNAGRISSALKLSERFQSRISTKVGNMIISASLRPKHSRRQRRQIRHASARLRKLVEQRGFEPDRVTLNLLFKALLRWKTITSPAILRALFDRLVVSGYPLPMQLYSGTSEKPTRADNRQNNGPTGLFGTTSSKLAQLPVDLKPLSKGLSFAKHTRPLYRMFKKAFEARGDTEGARRVASLLRSTKLVAAYEFQKREEARQIGRLLAKRRKSRPGSFPRIELNGECANKTIV